ncbi:hypothetical protein FQN50_005616 [Emmonsiellopsis sp. PD_5]|nr:hypothetical protein FQN50_005616 [Emmonsiellopsis sp. PD_5]
MSSLDDFLARGGRTQRIANMLNDIFARTKALEHTELTDNDLQNLGIRMSSFDADKISVAHPMGFYAPLPEEECPEIDWPGKDKHIWRWLPGLKEEPRRVDHHIQLVSSDFWYAWLEQEKDQPWVQRRIGSGEYPRLAPYEWQILGEVDSVNPHYPHCSFRVIHAAEPNQALRRSEVLPIAAVMKWRMRQWRYIKDHDILPVSPCLRS